MSNSKQRAFAILATTPVGVDRLMAIQAHNERRIPVPGADPTVVNGFKVLRLAGLAGCALTAVMNRFVEAGVLNPNGEPRLHKNRHVAVEVLLTFSDEADPMPLPEVLEKRGVQFLDDEFGRENVVGIWGHYDERTPHLQALVVPVCQARRPGRPPRGSPPKTEPVVSWQQFSGSHLREYRNRDSEAGIKRAVKDQNGNPVEPTVENSVMAGWQTRWALLWSDYGLRRGIPSRARAMGQKQIRQKIAHIRQESYSAEIALGDPRNWLGFSMRDWAELKANPTDEVLCYLVSKYLPAALKVLLAPLNALADRGIQLDATRQTLVELQDRHDAFVKDATAASEEHNLAREETKKLASEIANLRTENARLNDEIERLNCDRPLLNVSSPRSGGGALTRPPLRSPESGAPSRQITA